MGSKSLLLVVAVTLAGLAAAYAAGKPLALGFATGLAVLTLMAKYSGGTAWGKLGSVMLQGALHTKEVVFILLLVGMLIPSWTASGTIPYLIHGGLSVLHPAYFVTGSFILAAAISMLIGTSTGTLSAVGIPLMGAAVYVGIPLPYVAGALISGAFVGDRGSPTSSAFRLAASSAGVSVRAAMQAMLPTTIGAAVVCLVFYAWLDGRGGWLGGGEAELVYAAGELRDAFRLSPILLAPPILLLGSIALRMKTRTGFLAGICAAIAAGVVLQGGTFMDWLRWLWSGYSHHSLPHLHTKGVADMLALVLLIAMAGAYNGILEHSGALRQFAERLAGDSSGNLLGATWRTGLFGLCLGLVSCTQTLPIMMAGRTVAPLWRERYPESALARVISDSAVVFAAMVPWNMLAILCATIVGVPVEQYVPFAAFLWALPVLTLIASWHGSKGLATATRAALGKENGTI